jgi:hypothetical protein
MISPLPAMFTGHVVGSIKPSGFTVSIRPAVFPPIGLPVLAPIFSPVHLSVFAAILSAIQLTVFSPIPTPIINHIADIVPPATPTVIAISARPAID